MRDGSAADPCSLGVAILLANLTGQGNIDHLDYAGAARDQVDFLFQIVPQTNEGAVSHRVSELQLWCVSHSGCWCLRVSNHTPRTCWQERLYLYGAPVLGVPRRVDTKSDQGTGGIQPDQIVSESPERQPRWSPVETCRPGVRMD